MQLLMGVTGKSFKEAARAVDEIVGNVAYEQPQPKKDPRDRLAKIQSGLESMDGINPVRRYLHTRGLKPSGLTQYHPGLAYYEEGQFKGKFPAMVHVFRAPDASPLTYHVTYLTNGGEKAPVGAPKKVMPAIGELSGGAIRLAKAEPVLGIAEGIETALAATQRTGVPCWASYSATLLEQFQPPDGVGRVVVFGDNDASFTGQAASYALAKRLKREGYEVDVRIPERTGADWADQVSA
jgi:putative DNA primase/helicase